MLNFGERMSVQSKELSPVSMITEQLSNFHLTDRESIADDRKPLSVKKYFFDQVASIITFDSPKKEDESKIKPPSESSTVYYAVTVPKKTSIYSDDSGDAVKEEALIFERKEDALKAIKEHKHSRFKLFTSKEDAEKFSLQSDEPISSSSLTLPPTEEEDVLPSVKCQDLVKLRKAIEGGKAEAFKEMVWVNARYLVNYHGDTPSILHEGFRYNALHVAARSKQPLMCQLILDTLSDSAFFDKIYKCNSKIRAEKIHHLLDQYLNNPDKRLGETPLHFASKFGCLDTVKVLLSHPYCIKDKKNNDGKTAAQTICTRCSSTNENLRNSIEEAFKGLLYVPVLRAEGNAMPPCIEKPCTKVEIEEKLYASKQSVNSPQLIVKAFAGPMSPEAANAFYKVWKNPSSTPKQQSYTVDEQKCIHKIRLTDTEKGLERAGRNIAQDLKAEWLEYWPALDAFINLASSEGLKMLEKHLNNVYNPLTLFRKESEKENGDDSISSPTISSYINPLGHYLNHNLKDKMNGDDIEDDVFYTPPTSPKGSPKQIRNNGFELSRSDVDMFLAIRDIDTHLYPNISQWKNLIRSKLRSLEKDASKTKSLTPLASVRIPRLQRRGSRIGISPRNLFLKSDEAE